MVYPDMSVISSKHNIFLFFAHFGLRRLKMAGRRVKLTSVDYPGADRCAADLGRMGIHNPASHAQGHGASFRSCA